MRYQKIFTHFWHDEKVRRLSDDAKLLFLYILTSPHSNCVGIFYLPDSYIIGDLMWTPERLREPFRELLREGFLKRSRNGYLVAISNHLKYNSLDNPNQVVSAVKSIETLPTDYIDISGVLERLRKPFQKPLRERLAERFAKPETETEAETVTETVTEAVAERGGMGGETTSEPPTHSPAADDHQPRPASQAAPAKKKKFVKKRCTIPEDFALSESMAAYAAKNGIQGEDAAVEFEKFVNYHSSKGSLMADWEAAWRTWVGNWSRFGGNKSRTSSAAVKIDRTMALFAKREMRRQHEERQEPRESDRFYPADAIQILPN